MALDRWTVSFRRPCTAICRLQLVLLRVLRCLFGLGKSAGNTREDDSLLQRERTKSGGCQVQDEGSPDKGSGGSGQTSECTRSRDLREKNKFAQRRYRAKKKVCCALKRLPCNFLSFCSWHGLLN